MQHDGQQQGTDQPLHPLYTIGYSGQTLEGLRARLDELGAALVDIRFSTGSRVKHWRGPELKAYFGDRYWPVSCLGNENYRGGPIKLSNPELAVAPMRATLQARSVILMCGCSDVNQCHRKDAAAFLQEHLGVQVIHLPPPARALLTEKQIDVVKAMRDGWALGYHGTPTPYALTTDHDYRPVGQTTILALEGKGVIARGERSSLSYHLTELGNALQV